MDQKTIGSWSAGVFMDWMGKALECAKQAFALGEVPVGAVLVSGQSLVGVAYNQMRAQHCALAHAEMLVLHEAARTQPHPPLEACDLYVTLEPCPMCAYAIGLSRIRRLYFGAYDPKGGGVDHGPRVFQTQTLCRPVESVGGVRERESQALLREFFAQLRCPENSGLL